MACHLIVFSLLIVASVTGFELREEHMPNQTQEIDLPEYKPVQPLEPTPLYEAVVDLDDDSPAKVLVDNFGKIITPRFQTGDASNSYPFIGALGRVRNVGYAISISLASIKSLS